MASYRRDGLPSTTLAPARVDISNRASPGRCNQRKSRSAARRSCEGNVMARSGREPRRAQARLHSRVTSRASACSRHGASGRGDNGATDHAPRPLSPQRLLPLIIATALFIENMDSTAISTSLPQIAADLGVEPVALKLALTTYMLALAIFIPVSGWVADRFG